MYSNAYSINPFQIFHETALFQFHNLNEPEIISTSYLLLQLTAINHPWYSYYITNNTQNLTPNQHTSVTIWMCLLTTSSIRCSSGKYQISRGQASTNRTPFWFISFISCHICCHTFSSWTSLYKSRRSWFFLFLFIVYWISPYTTQLPRNSCPVYYFVWPLVLYWIYRYLAVGNLILWFIGFRIGKMYGYIRNKLQYAVEFAVYYNLILISNIQTCWFFD